MVALPAVVYTGFPRAVVHYEVQQYGMETYIILYESNDPQTRTVASDVHAVATDLLQIIKGAFTHARAVLFQDRFGEFNQIVFTRRGFRVRSFGDVFTIEAAIKYLRI